MPKREGISLLEYQAKPSLRDVAHEGWLSTVTEAGNSISSHTEKAGGTARTSRTKITPAGSLSSSQPGGPPCWASPLDSGLIGMPCVYLKAHLEEGQKD
jgi:hypothetical protein